MTQIRQLELELYGDDVMLDWLFKKQNKETPETISRREFLRRGGQVGAALVGLQVANSGIGKATEFLNQKGYGNSATEFMQENLGTKKALALGALPPGIADAASRNQVYAIAWNALKNKDFNRVVNLLNPQSSHYIGSKEWITEPVFYFIGNHTVAFSENILGSLRDGNLAMSHFSRFIDMYIRNYSPYKGPRKTGAAVGSMEEEGLKAIFVAAGRPASDVTGYLQMNEEQKKSYLQGVMSNLKKRDVVQQRIAAWTSTWLANYYYMTQGQNKQKEFKDLLEIPLRSYTGRIRANKGGPYYFDEKLKI